ncbi:MAG: ribose-phosphate diphosphokinase [Methanomicrobiales archaeon]|nr:ribose-phosphate diphosphokinase [Methanomicrobiales archaeon]
MKVACTGRSRVLGARIAEHLGAGLVETTLSRFPDGEIYLRTGVLDEATVVVGSLLSGDSLVELLLLIDACHRSEVMLVIPYMGYARQDREFKPGEPVSARAMARALSHGVSRVLTVNIHKESVLSHFAVPASQVNLAPAVGDFIRGLDLENPLILAPDRGAEPFAAIVASRGGWECDQLEKTRISGEEVRIEPRKGGPWTGDVVLVDDIISTGGTLATAARMLRAQGAKGVYAVCVHGLFAGTALDLLGSSGINQIAASDTIEGPNSRYSAAGPIAARLREFLADARVKGFSR